MADFLPLVGFVFFGLFSPGPNVILITTSGARFGMRATLPHVAGVVLGVGVIAGAVGLGLGALLTAYPTLTLALKITAFLWIVWMACGLWSARPVSRRKTDRPFTLIEATLFQWVNPKIWAVALSAMAYVQDTSPPITAVTLALVFSCTNLFVCLFWARAGTWLSFLRNSPRAWLVFMRIMAVGLVFFAGAVFL